MTQHLRQLVVRRLSASMCLCQLLVLACAALCACVVVLNRGRLSPELPLTEDETARIDLRQRWRGATTPRMREFLRSTNPTANACPPNHTLELNRHKQLCRRQDGSGNWRCMRGYRKIGQPPYCISKSRPPRYPAPPGCSLLRTPGALSTHKFERHLRDVTFRALCSTRPLKTSRRGRCYRLAPTEGTQSLSRRPNPPSPPPPADTPLAVNTSILCLPTFLLFGFSKTATTTLFRYLQQHPLASTSSPKELNFLSGPTSEVPSIRSYAEHHGRCLPCERGEGTPSYAWRDSSPNAAALASLLLGPATRLIAVVREPVARAVSHFLYFRAKRYRSLSLTQAMRLALDAFERCAALMGGWQHSCAYASGRSLAEHRDQEPAARFVTSALQQNVEELIQGGLYSEHLETWLKHFPPSALIVIDAARLLAAPLEELRRVERHLGLTQWSAYSFSHRHMLSALRASSTDQRGGAASAAAQLGEGAPGPGELTVRAITHDLENDVRLRAAAFFAPFNRKLTNLTGIVFDAKEEAPR